MTDPFAPPGDDNRTSPDAAPQGDPFGQPAKSLFPKVEDLEGSLLLLKPVKIEAVARPAKFGGGMIDRASVDTIVLGPDGTEEYDAMYWSQEVIVKAMKQALKPGAAQYILGRLVKAAQKDTQTAYKIDGSPEAFKAAREEWLRKGGKGDGPKHVWLLTDFTDEDAEIARAYFATKASA